MKKQVLVVDDDQLMHRLFQHHLERAGYQMVSALNGREALDLAARQPPDLIVMDIMMPDIDGLAALRELQKDGRHEFDSGHHDHGERPSPDAQGIRDLRRVDFPDEAF